MNIFIIGTGMGDTKNLTVSAREKIENADIIIGARRVAEPFADGKRRVYFEYDADRISDIIRENPEKNIAVMFSGDISFFSGAKKLCALFPKAQAEPGISCVSYFCAKIGISYDDMNIVSMHGRECNIASEVRGHKKTFALLGENPCAKLCRFGLGGAEVFIGENLSYETEKILRGTAEELRYIKTDPLSVIIIINENFDARARIGIKNEEFITGSAPITKSEVRAVSVSRLEIKPDDICLDIGAGTGSVSVEMALLCPKGRVYAVEKNAEAAELIEKNAVKFTADNIEVIRGEAPDALNGLPKADKVFIGGSSGKIDEIIEKCACPKIVVNAITLENLTGTLKAFEERGYSYEVTQISAAKGRKIGNYNMMTAQNPVFVICGEKR
ncbi:MAG: precorrin-6Y C5,15-methyltransferase (decarboxylating) subunit CbiT [Oscillospiraceae bacterium]|nr:precorrin-6Y C5,15-methyltransferase (decarboxylating) subunit CbiT [Oscillospiraceae bacterium]